MTEQPNPSLQQKKNQRIILIIFAMSIVPFLAAALSLWQGFIPKGTKMYGHLIDPALATCGVAINNSEKKTCNSEFSGFDAFSTAHLSELSGHWLLVNVIPKAHCNEICLKAILETRQIRLMLNRDIPRTRRMVMLLTEPNPEDVKLWWLKETLLWSLNSGTGKDEAQIKRDSERYNLMLSENENVDGLIQELIAAAEAKKTLAEVKSELPLTSDLIKVKPSASLLKKLLDLNKGEIPDGTLYLIDPLGNIIMHYAPGFNPYKVKEDLMQLLKASQMG